MPTIKILRVVGIRGKDPVVLAVVEGWLVRWQPDDGWTCECPEALVCPHVDPVADLLDDRVLGDDQ